MSAFRRPAATELAGRGALLFSLAVLALFAYAAYEMNTGFTTRARLFGNTIIIPALILAGAQVVREVRRVQPLVVPREAAFTRAALVWATGFFVSMALIGLAVTIPLFTLLYLRFSAQEAWAKAAVYALAVWVFVDLLFVRLLHVPLPGGAIPLPAIAN